MSLGGQDRLLADTRTSLPPQQTPQIVQQQPPPPTQQSQPNMPQIPSAQTPATDSISKTLNAMTPTQLLEVLTQFKVLKTPLLFIFTAVCIFKRIYFNQ